LNQEAIKQLTAGAVRSMEERVRADPDLQRFGDIGGLLNMNRQDILHQGGREAAGAAAAAEKDLGKKDPRVEKAPGGAGIEGPPAPTPAERKAADEKVAGARDARITALKEKLGMGGFMGNTKMALLEGLAAGGAQGLSEEQKELVKLSKDKRDADTAKEQAEKGGDGAAAGGDGKGGGKTQHIKITGNLTVKADGAAMIDADNEVPPNP
jgi:hypothetical protein